MSLRPQASYTVPEETARVAHAVLPKGNVYLRLADTLGSMFEDAAFADLFPVDGQPALSPVRWMLVLILKFAEGLSDRQAAEAVCARIDWTHLLCLEITDPGFDYGVLSEFRARLIERKWKRSCSINFYSTFERGVTPRPEAAAHGFDASSRADSRFEPLRVGRRDDAVRPGQPDDRRPGLDPGA